MAHFTRYVDIPPTPGSADFHAMDADAQSRAMRQMTVETFAAWLVVEQAVKQGAIGIAVGVNDDADIRAIVAATPWHGVHLGNAKPVPRAFLHACVNNTRLARARGCANATVLAEAQDLARTVCVEKLVVASLLSAPPVGSA